MSFEDETCMGCGRAWRDGGLTFQCLLALCGGCYARMGGKDGVIAFGREIDARLQELRGALVRTHLAALGFAAAPPTVGAEAAPAEPRVIKAIPGAPEWAHQLAKDCSPGGKLHGSTELPENLKDQQMPWPQPRGITLDTPKPEYLCLKDLEDGDYCCRTEPCPLHDEKLPGCTGTWISASDNPGYRHLSHMHGPCPVHDSERSPLSEPEIRELLKEGEALGDDWAKKRRGGQ